MLNGISLPCLQLFPILQSPLFAISFDTYLCNPKQCFQYYVQIYQDTLDEYLSVLISPLNEHNSCYPSLDKHHDYNYVNIFNSSHVVYSDYDSLLAKHFFFSYYNSFVFLLPSFLSMAKLPPCWGPPNTTFHVC